LSPRSAFGPHAEWLSGPFLPAAGVRRLGEIARQFDVNPVANSVVYSASKSAAIDAVTRALAIELAWRRIRVNVVAHGMTATEGLAAMGVDEAAAKSIGAGLPIGRIARPDDIARVAAFLGSDRAAFAIFTCQMLPVFP
jgi:NAD(P)-dependent dehydrogenase (short-subunit alcohol dehydrogenase family)